MQHGKMRKMFALGVIKEVSTAFLAVMRNLKIVVSDCRNSCGTCPALDGERMNVLTYEGAERMNVLTYEGAERMNVPMKGRKG